MGQSLVVSRWSLAKPLLVSVRRAAIPRDIRHRWPTTNLAIGCDCKNHRLRVVCLQNVFRANIAGWEDRNERRWSSGLLHAGTSFRFFALHQADHTHNFKSEFATRCDGLYRGSSVCANVVDNPHAHAFTTNAYLPLSDPVAHLYRAIHESL